MANEIVIKILNREYFIEGMEDPLVLSALAEYLEKKMKEVSQKQNIVDTSRVAVHAALMITKELFDEKNKLENLEKNQEIKCVQMLEDLSKLIES